MPNYCFINGDVIPAKEATIKISDIGLLRGYAVFDFMRVNNGKPFLIDHHLQRFRNSAKNLHLPVAYSDEELKAIINDLLSRSEVQEAGIRIILTGGYAVDSMTINEPNLIISVEKVPVYPEEIYKEGVKLMTYEYQRDTPASKTTEYLNAVRLEPEKQRQNAFDILYYKGDEVLEITRNNFFLFSNDILITPKDNILHGITRKVLIQLAEGVFETEERKVHFDELRTADEAFLCGTSKRIVPVVQIDDFRIGHAYTKVSAGREGRVGANTRKLMQLFDAYVADA